MTEIIGRLISLIMLFSIGRQVYKQRREGKSESVSKWLFAGQIAAV